MYTVQFIYLKINYFFNYLFDILTMTPITRYEFIDKDDDVKEDDDEEIIYINEHMIIERE
jgi:hypothetical protein